MCGRHAAQLPNAKGATLGKLPKGPAWDKAAAEAARTIPGRENGGNCDIKNLSRGCKASNLPLYHLLQFRPAAVFYMVFVRAPL